MFIELLRICKKRLLVYYLWYYCIFCGFSKLSISFHKWFKFISRFLQLRYNIKIDYFEKFPLVTSKKERYDRFLIAVEYRRNKNWRENESHLREMKKLNCYAIL